MNCPYCGAKAEVQPEFDGIGYHCPSCGALECGEEDEREKMLELELITQDEFDKGWYRPGTIFNG
jgi:hypothetical protein